ncbi:MAG TPA: DsbA family oxidoreductase [Candidatus Kryptonia bacterium]
MKVEIWSDVVCPFCYMGKRKFEIALDKFEHKDGVEILWHSFQLNPEFNPGAAGDIHEYLANRYGRSREWAKEMHDDLVARAKEVGLEYKFDNIIPANTFDAHRLIHLAAKHGLQGKAEERLFAAYFTEGKDINEFETLVLLGTEIGLDPAATRKALESGEFEDEVRQDLDEAESLGITGVPFFVFNRKYAISGAQPTHLFMETLDQVWNEEHVQEKSLLK